VESKPQSWWSRFAYASKVLFWLILVFLIVQMAFAPYRLDATRSKILKQFQEERKSRVIAMIHRRETISFLGVPVSSSISIEDSEAVLRAIRLTPPEQPIDFILHTPGGLVLAAEQIAKALVEHKGKVTVFVPHYAMSGGTLIALTADEIVMDPNAVLGPVDPQIGGMPAASIVKLLKLKPSAKISDEMLILADVATKARLQVTSFVAEILSKHLPKNKALDLAVILSEGRWTHDFPITVGLAKQFGIPITVNMPQTIYNLMDLYPQSDTGRPSVLYVPLRPAASDKGKSPRRSPSPPT
jgi:ClpP class serine protease